MIESTNKKVAKIAKKKRFINIVLVSFAFFTVLFIILGAQVMEKFSRIEIVEELAVIEDENYKGEIDERLRFIAMQEEEMARNAENFAQDDIETAETGEIILKEPEAIAAFLEKESGKKNKFEEYNEKYRKKQTDENPEINLDEHDVPFNKDVAISQADITLKVVIGDFASRENAQLELERIKSQFTATPFIKNVNGRYTLQVGSFKTQATANAFVSSLVSQGYNARIIEE